MVDDLTKLMSKKAEEYTDKDVDELIVYYREQRTRFVFAETAKPVKPVKAVVKKAVKFDLDDLKFTFS